MPILPQPSEVDGQGEAQLWLVSCLDPVDRSAPPVSDEQRTLGIERERKRMRKSARERRHRAHRARRCERNAHDLPSGRAPVVLAPLGDEQVPAVSGWECAALLESEAGCGGVWLDVGDRGSDAAAAPDGSSQPPARPAVGPPVPCPSPQVPTESAGSPWPSLSRPFSETYKRPVCGSAARPNGFRRPRASMRRSVPSGFTDMTVALRGSRSRHASQVEPFPK